MGLQPQKRPFAPQTHLSRLPPTQLLFLGAVLLLALAAYFPAGAPAVPGGQSSQTAAAEPPAAAALTLSAEAGFAGYYKNSLWIPLHVTAANDGPDLEAQVEVRVQRLDNSSVRYTYAVSLPSGARKAFFLHIYPETFFDFRNFELALRDQASGKVLKQIDLRLDPLESYDRLFGVIAERPSAYSRLAALAPPDAKAFVAPLDLSTISDHPQGLEAIDVLVVSGRAAGDLQPDQRAALAGWLRSGGLLFVTGGADWQRAAAGLADFLPITPQDTRQLPDLAALTNFTAAGGAGQPIDGQTVVATGALQPQAEVLASQDSVPLLVRRAFGAGQVVYLAVDPSAAPLADWPGLTGLFQAILDQRPAPPAWAHGFNDWNAAARAGSQPGLRLPSVLLVCGLLVVYTLALGPLNFIILHRLKRRELAWASIPLLVLVFSGLTYLVGAQLRGSTPLLSRMALVQVWPGATQARLDGLLGLFSPFRTTYQLEIGSQHLAHPLPADTPGNGSAWTITQTGSGLLLPDLRLEVGGMRTLAVSGLVPAPAFDQDLSLVIDSTGATLRGSLTNNSQLLLTGSALLIPNQTRRFGDFVPGETKEIQAVINAEPAAAEPAAGLQPLPPKQFMESNADGQLQDDLLGTTDFYGNYETRRRYEFLNALLSLDPNSPGLGSGFYFSGWAEASPLSAGLVDRQAQTDDVTLYLIALDPLVTTAPGPLLLPPALFRWTVFEPGPTDRPSPYQTWLYAGSYSLEYRLGLSIPYQTIVSLSLELRSYGATGACPLAVSLWDFSAGAWQPLPDMQWGSNPIPSPERFVGPGGTIRLRLANADQTGVSIEAAEFVLMVE